MNINIIGTGSSGNSILLDETLLIDAGMPYKYIEEYIDNIKYVLLTHIHGDHFNKTTIRKIHISNADIKFCCGSFLRDDILNIGVDDSSIVTIETGKLYKTKGLSFSPVKLYHDVDNYGYRILSDSGYKHFHATDTDHLEGITAIGYDSATLECNHDIESANNIICEKKKSGEFCHITRAMKTHLSVQYSVEFIKKNKIKKLIPVHIGSSTKDCVIKYIKKHNL